MKFMGLYLKLEIDNKHMGSDNLDKTGKINILPSKAI